MGIELQFRQLVKNHKPASSSIATIVCVMVVGVCWFASPASVQAQTRMPEKPTVNQTREAEEDIPEQVELRNTLKEILNGEEFHQNRQQSHLRFKNAQDLKNDDVPQWMISFAEFLERHGGTFKSIASTRKTIAAWFGWLAQGIEVILWCLVALCIGWLVYLYREYFQRLLNIKSKAPLKAADEPEQLFGLDLRESSLPEKPLDIVKKLWQSHEHREAISLLYRATLIHLINEKHMPFRSGYTEYDCFTAVRAVYPNAPLTHYFARLSSTWEIIAYAHRVPDEASVQLLMAQWTEIIEHGE